MRKEAIAFVLVAVIAIAVIGVGYFAIMNKQRSIPVSLSADGLILNATISSKTLRVGETLGISISLYNSLSIPLNLTAVSFNLTSLKVSGFQVNGFPVAMWGSCVGLEPIEFVIVKGNFSVGELQAASVNSTYPGIACAEGGAVNYVSFLPKSSNVTTTGDSCISACSLNHETLNLITNFSVDGYWGLPLNNSEANDIYTNSTASCFSQPGQSVPCGITYNYPEVGPLAQHPFTSGLYTLAVSDAWGQTVLLYFSVE
jgi:hypothetical protein